MEGLARFQSHTGMRQARAQNVEIGFECAGTIFRIKNIGLVEERRTNAEERRSQTRIAGNSPGYWQGGDFQPVFQEAAGYTQIEPHGLLGTMGRPWTAGINECAVAWFKHYSGSILRIRPEALNLGDDVGHRVRGFRDGFRKGKRAGRKSHERQTTNEPNFNGTMKRIVFWKVKVTISADFLCLPLPGVDAATSRQGLR